MQSNIQTLENNLKHAEEQAAASLLDEAKVQDLEGLPMAEIREELDEKGNVLCTFYKRLMYIPILTSSS